MDQIHWNFAACEYTYVPKPVSAVMQHFDRAGIVVEQCLIDSSVIYIVAYEMLSIYDSQIARELGNAFVATAVSRQVGRVGWHKSCRVIQNLGC